MSEVVGREIASLFQSPGMNNRLRRGLVMGWFPRKVRDITLSAYLKGLFRWPPMVMPVS
jgi:hypothetical protein